MTGTFKTFYVVKVDVQFDLLFTEAKSILIPYDYELRYACAQVIEELNFNGDSLSSP